MAGRTFIARHGETVFNADQRIQGEVPHTPLTRTGFAQADAMGAALAKWLGTRQTLELWSSPAGRAQQTMAIMAEHIGGDFHDVKLDARLREIDMGEWSGRRFADIEAEIGPFACPETRLFTQVPQGGETYSEVAARLRDWIDEVVRIPDARLVVMHGMGSRVLRGLLLNLPADPRFGVPIAPSLPQGSLVMIGNGEEKIIRLDQTGTVE